MFHSLVRSVAVPAVRLLCRPVVEGAVNVPRRGRVILAGNHLSFIDSVVINLVAPRPVAFLAKADYFRGRGVKGRAVRGFFGAFGAVPVERGGGRSALGSLEVARQVLDGEGVFGIYPEGTRSLDGRLYRGRTGVAWLALSSGAPVVPVALSGTERLQPVGRRVPRPHRVTVRFGKPLHFSERYDGVCTGAARRAVTDEIMRAIGELSGQERVASYNELPSGAAAGAGRG
ncbi:lysophospholipid acyltransferase family protein [Streptomyces gamaensis]|uniref:Lysophospholipid acyltransferase family protein n=1 Tax=Streptomyces gamaensis TaxID=1763542 RepID=A0ABW0Z213_9ACTN